MTRHPFRLGLLATALLCAPLRAEDPALRELLRDALYTEEVTRDAEKAAAQYEEILSRHDEQRAFAASALFRLAEVRRKQDRKDDAIALYQRLLREFPAAEAEAKLARENLAALGEKLPAAEIVAEDEETMEIQRLEKLMATSPDRVHNFSGLVSAVENNRPRVVRYLLESGAAPTDETAGFVAAAALGHLVIVEAFLELATDRVKGGMPRALAEAVRKGNIKVARVLVDAGAATDWQPDRCVLPRNANLRDFEFEGTPLITAIANNRIEIVEMLLEKKPDLRQRANATGISVIHAAAHLEEPAATRLAEQLIARGADPNALTEPLSLSETATQKLTLSPLQYAVLRGNWSIAKLLIRHGADLKQPGLFDPFLSQESGDLATAAIRFLLENGADANLLDREGRTQLSTALRKKNRQQFEFLLKAGADPDTADQDGSTPLTLAAHSSDTESARLLLEAGADPNKPNAHSTPLAIAAKSDLGWPVVELLLEKGAKPDAAAFKRAMTLSKWDVALKMLEAGAPLPEAAESYPWEAPLVRALQSPAGLPAFEKMLAMGAKLDEAWIKSGFHYPGQDSRVPVSRLPYLFRTFMLPRLESDGGIRLVIHDERGTSVSVLEEPEPISSRRMPLARLLLAPKEPPRWSLLPTDRLTLWRKTGGEWKAAHEFAIGGDDAFPALEPGDVIELTDDPSAKGRQSTGTPSPELKWSLRQRISFPVSVEIDGQKQDVKLRGDRLVLDPTTRDLPLTGARGVIALLWQPEIDLQEGLWRRSINAEVVVHRDGWPEVRIPYTSTGEDFPLQEGDRIALAMPELAADQKPELRRRRVTVKGDNFPFARHFGEWTASQGLQTGSVPTLMQALAEVMQLPLRDAPDEAEALPPYLITNHRTTLAFIQRPDFSRIRIRRLQEDGSEKVIAVDLAGLIAASTEADTPEKIRASDLELQAGDIVELAALPPREGEPWTGLTAKEQSYFAKALDCRVQVTEANGRLTLQEIRFQAPRMIDTAAGLVPLPPATGVASLSAFAALKASTGSGIRIWFSRGNHPASSLSPDALFLREGDRLDRPRVPSAPSPRLLPPRSDKR